MKNIDYIDDIGGIDMKTKMMKAIDAVVYSIYDGVFDFRQDMRTTADVITDIFRDIDNSIEYKGTYSKIIRR